MKCQHTNLREINEFFTYTNVVVIQCLDCKQRIWSNTTIFLKPGEVKPNKKIIRKIASLKNKIDKIDDQITEIQDNCVHARVDAKYKSSSGNYDPAENEYWVNIKCLDCDKSWTEYQ
jgi:hypothetical protein